MSLVVCQGWNCRRLAITGGSEELGLGMRATEAKQRRLARTPWSSWTCSTLRLRKSPDPAPDVRSAAAVGRTHDGTGSIIDVCIDPARESGLAGWFPTGGLGHEAIFGVHRAVGLCL